MIRPDFLGEVLGKAGFKLSANALYPKEDYEWIVKGGTYQVLTAESGGPRTPRINLEEPQKSLLLTKPTMEIPHGGGLRINPDSADYETIVDWVRKGAPYGEEESGESIRVTGIEVSPKSVVLDSEGVQQLLVTAHLSNSRQEDITDQVLYVSNNTEVVEVDGTGLVRPVKTGETAVMIRAAGNAVSAGFGVAGSPLEDYPKVPRRNYIDDYVFSKLRKFNVVPSGLSSDQEFLRRVCLDITGTLPPPERVREFLLDKDPQKRDKLIEILLDSSEYIDYWTFRFAELFRVAMGPQGDLKHTKSYWEWVRGMITENVPYDEIARQRIAAQGLRRSQPSLLPYRGRAPRAGQHDVGTASSVHGQAAGLRAVSQSPLRELESRSVLGPLGLLRTAHTRRAVGP